MVRSGHCGRFAAWFCGGGVIFDKVIKSYVPLRRVDTRERCIGYRHVLLILKICKPPGSYGETRVALTFQSGRVEWVTYLPPKIRKAPQIVREISTNHFPINLSRSNSKSERLSLDGGNMRTDMIKERWMMSRHHHRPRPAMG